MLEVPFLGSRSPDEAGRRVSPHVLHGDRPGCSPRHVYTMMMTVMRRTLMRCWGVIALTTGLSDAPGSGGPPQTTRQSLLIRQVWVITRWRRAPLCGHSTWRNIGQCPDAASLNLLLSYGEPEATNSQ